MKIATLIAIALSFNAAANAADVPQQPLVSATSVFVCDKGIPHLVTLIATFPDGTVVRIDSDHMHGFKTAKQILEYGETAKDKFWYGANCGGDTSA